MAAPDIPPFDAQVVAAELRNEGGFDARQADAVVRATVASTANLATRTDIATLKTDLEHAVSNAKKDAQTEVQKALNSQTWRYLGLTGAMLGLLRWLFPVG